MTKWKKLLTGGRISTLVLSLFMSVMIAGSYAGVHYEGFINNALQLGTGSQISGGGEDFYKSTYKSQDELYKAKVALIKDVVREGSVLLKNENGTLPLDPKTQKNVSVFGTSSTNIVMGISGGASIVSGPQDKLTDVLRSVGLTVNPTLYDFYANSGYTHSYSGTFKVGEVPVDDYTPAVKSSYAQYGDAAIVVLSRSKGEGADFSLDPSSVSDGDGVHHGLGIQQAERDMIAEAKKCSNNVIVLINSDYAMEIDDLKNDDGIGAILWIGGVGLNGIYGVADILVGNANPSGRLADTYAVDVTRSPAAQGWLGEEYSNVSVDIQKAYIVYQEGIYVGYKYYETRYEDAVLGQGDASSAVGASGDAASWNYGNEVSYSFGYGMSYSTFTEEITGFEVSGTKATMNVKVTNTNGPAGKHVVQVYAQSPYTEYDKLHDVEKAAVQLVAFKKTGRIASGGHEDVTVEIDLHNLASYDYKEAKTYIMDAGTYYFAVGNGAHDALNNILAAKGKTAADDGMDYDGDASKVKTNVIAELDSTTYAVSQQTGYAITNRLADADINYYYSEEPVTYLSRSNWSGTFPKAALNLTANDKMLAALKDGASYTATVATAADKAKMVYGAEKKYSLIEMRDEKFGSEKWDALLDQLTLEEMSRIVGASGGGIKAVDSVTFAGSVMRDGPAGPKANYTDGAHKKEDAVMYMSEVVLASTFDKEMAEKVGKMMGNDCLWLNTHAMYAPGVNTHRTPMSGRNSEYYSEDSVLASAMGSAQVLGASEFGLIMGPKHFAFNDQEAHRHGIGTFFNEQAGREIYLRAFEMPMTNSHGLMSAYNRVGCTYSSAHVGLMTEILRNEWGFHGYAISDAVGSRVLSKYADGPASVTAGLTMYCVNTDTLFCGSNGSLNTTAITNDPVLFEAMKEACHETLYAFVHSSAVNGYAVGMTITEVTPWWKATMIAVDCVLGAMLLGAIACYVIGYIKNRKDEVTE